MRIFKIFTSIILLLSITSCNTKFSREIARKFPGRPDRYYKEQLKSASPDVRDGWDAGCNSGMSATSNTFYKTLYQINDADGFRMMESSEYRTAWNAAFWFCQRHDYVRQKSPIWSQWFSGYK